MHKNPLITSIESIRKADAQAVLDQLRFAMQADGGGGEIVEVQGNDIIIVFRGTCTSCPSRALTLGAIEKTMKSQLTWVERLIEVPDKDNRGADTAIKGPTVIVLEDKRSLP